MTEPPTPTLKDGEYYVSVTARCGHEVTYRENPRSAHAGARRLKHTNRPCGPCRHAEQNAKVREEAFKQRFKAKQVHLTSGERGLLISLVIHELDRLDTEYPRDDKPHYTLDQREKHRKLRERQYRRIMHELAHPGDAAGQYVAEESNGSKPQTIKQWRRSREHERTD